MTYECPSFCRDEFDRNRRFNPANLNRRRLQSKDS